MSIMRESFLLFFNPNPNLGDDDNNNNDQRHDAQCQLIQAALLAAGNHELQLNWWLEQLRGQQLQSLHPLLQLQHTKEVKARIVQLIQTHYMQQVNSLDQLMKLQKIPEIQSNEDFVAALLQVFAPQVLAKAGFAIGRESRAIIIPPAGDSQQQL